MAIMEFALFDVDKLLVWISKFSPSRILTAVCKAGQDAWNSFRKWFFGLDFDAHEWAVDHFMPLIPDYTERMEQLNLGEKASINKVKKLEDCLEFDKAVEEYYNEETQQTDENGNVTWLRAPARRQIKKIKEGHVQDAIAAVEARIRNRHMIYGDDISLVDEAAVRATAIDICGEMKINEHHSKVLIYAAAYRAMTPDQDSLDAVKMAYNPKSQARRSLVTAVRKNISFGGFKSLEDF